MNLTELVVEVWKRTISHPNERKGQAAFNVLTIHRPDLAEQIRTTDNDPFYNDDRLRDFYDWLYHNWTEEPTT